ncbi:MAG: hypothetical protein K1000chlam3_00525 [Chlamydiae bacterium]|nr:hypothetical protein [Chlamydiota bacterium]
MINKILNPTYYHRQYDLDLPENPQDPSYFDSAKRFGRIAIPFLSLYHPFGRAISVSMGGVRLLSNGVGMIAAKDTKELAYETMQVGLSGLALAGTLYDFRVGLYLTTAVDLTMNLMSLAKNPEKSNEALLQAFNSTLYLSIMHTGSLEMIVASMLTQSAVNFYQAKEEWQKGHLPEVFAKSLMGAIRLYQANSQIPPIEVKKTDHLKDHPLKNLSKKIKENEVILKDAEGKKHNFGAHFHGYGKQLVKGMNIHFKENEETIELNFKVNHVFRDRLQQRLEMLEKNPNENSLSKGDFFYNIQSPGLGRVTIGAKESVISIYDQVEMQMGKNKTLYDFHKMLSFLNLDDALRKSSEEDIERMKMGHLFRILNPPKATVFERSAAFFDLSLEKFKQQIFWDSPEMESQFTKWLPKMELREILPGRMRWAVDGLADELKKYGLQGLTNGLQNSGNKNIASILKMGMFSKEMQSAFLNKPMTTSDNEAFNGGSDSVFTQMVIKDHHYFDYFSPVRLFFSPKILEFGSYQYDEDEFGSRQVCEFTSCPYSSRKNIFDSLKGKLGYGLSYQKSHEVMIKDRISPEYITGLTFMNEEDKHSTIRYLREKNIIQKDTILSKPIDQFFHVGHGAKDEQFD